MPSLGIAGLVLTHLMLKALALACRISIEKDTKVTNAATFTIQREDHTVGNLVRM